MSKNRMNSALFLAGCLVNGYLVDCALLLGFLPYLYLCWFFSACPRTSSARAASAASGAAAGGVDHYRKNRRCRASRLCRVPSHGRDIFPVLRKKMGHGKEEVHGKTTKATRPRNEPRQRPKIVHGKKRGHGKDMEKCTAEKMQGISSRLAHHSRTVDGAVVTAGLCRAPHRQARQRFE